MKDKKLEQIDREIEKLKNLREAREEELVDPERQEVYRLYRELDRILGRLDELGENIEDGDGYGLYIVGRLFSYSYGDGVTEHENPERKRRKRK